jgi:IS4 transposase
LDDSAARYFRAVLDDCIRSQVGGIALKLQEQYACFVTAFIQDSTIIRLNKKLADRFPAARTRRVAAGVKVAYLLNVLANGPRTVSIVPERTADAKTLKVGPWVAGSLLLLDLGYYGYRLFARIHENKGFFVSRVKKGSKLTITAVHSPMPRNQLNALIGQDLSSVIKGVDAPFFDATVTVLLKRRAYRGKQRQEQYPFRCVGRVHPDTGEWHFYLTNLDPDEFTVDEIADLYRFRWEIESLFDEAKNECTLGDIEVKREEATMTLLLAMLIRQVVLRRVYLVLRTLLDEATRQKLSPKLYGRAFIEQMDLLLEILVDEGKPPGEQVRGGDGWGLWFERLSRNSLQYHPKKLVRDTILKR